MKFSESLLSSFPGAKDIVALVTKTLSDICMSKAMFYFLSFVHNPTGFFFYYLRILKGSFLHVYF